jgi:ricin-type beta-trefoil lectin protein
VFKLKFIPVLSAAAVSLAVALFVPGGGVAQAAPTQVAPFAGVFNPIRNVGDNKCLQPVSPVESSPVVQATCDGGLAQGWQAVQVGTNHYRFVNQLSGLCLFAFSPPARNGNPMGLALCRTVSNEEFNAGTSLPNVVALESRMSFRDSGFCLDVPGGRADEGLQMQLFQCNGTLAQRWVVGFA